MSFLWSAGAFIIAIGVLVFVHEFGHFWAARKCGIHVHRFSIGFGKVIWSKVDRKGTEFAISLIPLGGYVKMLDGRNEELSPELCAFAFDHKTVLQRVFVIIAGPLANFIFAIAMYTLVYMLGIPNIKPVIAEVIPQSIAAQAELEPDMQILEIDGIEIADWESINMLLTAKLGDKQAVLTLKPFTSPETLYRTLNLSNWHFEPEQETAFSSLGIKPLSNKVLMVLSKVAKDSPAHRAGLQIGDRILKGNNEELDWHRFVQLVQKGKPIQLEFEQGNQLKTVVISPERNAEKQWYVGVSPTFLPVPDEYRDVLKYDILVALQKAIEKTAQLSWLTLKVIGKLFTGDLSLSNLSGPVSIAKGAGASAEIGFVYYLTFIALISVNLGIMNLFPLPVLDGGHLIFLIIEGIMRKPVSIGMQNIFYRIGTMLLLLLMVFALFNDLLRL